MLPVSTRRPIDFTIFFYLPFCFDFVVVRCYVTGGSVNCDGTRRG